MRRKQFFPKDPVIPSRVTDRMYIHYPVPETDSEDDDSSSSEDEESQTSEDELSPRDNNIEPNEIFSGKWMLFYDKSRIDISRGMTHHDYFWQFTFPLVDNEENTGIFAACCSTAYRGVYPADPASTDGVIICFTKDYRNKYEVKKAGDAIRNFMYYPKDMFYKTDIATITRQYRCYGSKFVSIYKHTPDNIIYERDEKLPYVWNPVHF